MWRFKAPDAGGRSVAVPGARFIQMGAVATASGMAYLVLILVPSQAVVALFIVFGGVVLMVSGVRRMGIIRFLPESTRMLLTETSLLDWLTDTAFFDAIKPYLLFCLGLSDDEMMRVLRALPPAVRVSLTRPGLVHSLPASLQRLLLPPEPAPLRPPRGGLAPQRALEWHAGQPLPPPARTVRAVAVSTNALSEGAAPPPDAASPAASAAAPLTPGGAEHAAGAMPAARLVALGVAATEGEVQHARTGAGAGAAYSYRYRGPNDVASPPRPTATVRAAERQPQPEEARAAPAARPHAAERPTVEDLAYDIVRGRALAAMRAAVSAVLGVEQSLGGESGSGSGGSLLQGRRFEAVGTAAAVALAAQLWLSRRARRQAVSLASGAAVVALASTAAVCGAAAAARSRLAPQGPGTGTAASGWTNAPGSALVAATATAAAALRQSLARRLRELRPAHVLLLLLALALARRRHAALRRLAASADAPPLYGTYGGIR